MIPLPWSRRCECLVFARVCRCVRPFRSGWHPCLTAEMRTICGSFGAANSQQDKEPGTVTPLLTHICPQCGQFSGISKGVGNAGF